MVLLQKDIFCSTSEKMLEHPLQLFIMSHNTIIHISINQKESTNSIELYSRLYYEARFFSHKNKATGYTFRLAHINKTHA